jgi:hypothetical protein
MKWDYNKARRCFVKIRFHETLKYPSLAETVYFKDNMTVDFFLKWKCFFYTGKLCYVLRIHMLL